MTIDQQQITTQLDRIEDKLPMIPSKTVAFGRATARRTTETASTIIGEVTQRTETIGRTVATATRTTAGQARSVADRTITTVRNGVAEVTGQSCAQTAAVIDSIEHETTELLDSATAAVDPATHRPASLDDLNKDELYGRAQVANVSGRSTMSKDELVEALRS